MSDTKVAFELVLAALTDLKSSIDSLRSEVIGVRVALVSHAEDERQRDEIVTATLTQLSSRLKTVERNFAVNGGREQR